jgi:exosome complex component RRP41
VLQADGGEAVAAINAATLALIDAGVAMRDYVVACSVGCLDGTNVLDINRTESGARGPELTVAILPKTERIVTTIMESRVHADQFKGMLDMSLVGCASVYTALRTAVVDRTSLLAATTVGRA